MQILQSNISTMSVLEATIKPKIHQNASDMILKLGTKLDSMEKTFVKHPGIPVERMVASNNPKTSDSNEKISSKNDINQLDFSSFYDENVSSTSDVPNLQNNNTSQEQSLGFQESVALSLSLNNSVFKENDLSKLHTSSPTFETEMLNANLSSNQSILLGSNRELVLLNKTEVQRTADQSEGLSSMDSAGGNDQDGEQPQNRNTISFVIPTPRRTPEHFINQVRSQNHHATTLDYNEFSFNDASSTSDSIAEILKPEEFSPDQPSLADVDKNAIKKKEIISPYAMMSQPRQKPTLSSFKIPPRRKENNNNDFEFNQTLATTNRATSADVDVKLPKATSQNDTEPISSSWENEMTLLNVSTTKAWSKMFDFILPKVLNQTSDNDHDILESFDFSPSAKSATKKTRTTPKTPTSKTHQKTKFNVPTTTTKKENDVFVFPTQSKQPAEKEIRNDLKLLNGYLKGPMKDKMSVLEINAHGKVDKATALNQKKSKVPLPMASPLVKKTKKLQPTSRSSVPWLAKSRILKPKDDLPNAPPSDGVIVHYGFESVNLNTVYDESGVDNNARLSNGAHLNKGEAKCGASIELAGGEISLPGESFKYKPENGISVAMWVKLNKEVDNVVFFTVKPSIEGEGATYVFEVKDGKIHWSHTGASLDTIFDVLTVQRSTVPEGMWTHLAATYNSRTRHAKLYVDTQLIMTESGSGKLSTEWHGKVAIGADGTLPGFVDEFYLYDKAISLSDVKDLSELCNLNADYPIPMDKGAYTGLIPDEQVQEMKDRLSGKNSADRHSSVDNQDDDGDETTKSSKCKKDAILYGSDLRGGKNSGLFYAVGKVSDINECIMHCCETARCDLAYMDNRKCFVVICHFPSLCQPIKADSKRLTLGYVERDGKSVYDPDVYPTEPSLLKTTRKTTTGTTAKRKTCLQSMVYYGVALRGGWTAGKFTDMGLVRNLQQCVEFCCNDTSCDLSMVLAKRCYKVHCYNLADCQTTAGGHAQIAYVSRESNKMIATSKPEMLAGTKSPLGNQVTKPPFQVAVTFSPVITSSVPELACHLSFDKINEDRILDDSRYGNDATLSNGANISPGGGIRGNGVVLFGGDVLLDGENFRPKPRKAITVAMWVKLSEKDGAHSLFDTIGSHSSHTQGQYHLEIIDGKVHWSHRDEVARVIFSVLTIPIIPINEWTNIAVTYDSAAGEAKIFVDGNLVGAGEGHGLLSLDWGSKAGFGTHPDGRAFLGYIDDIYIYTTALTKGQIKSYVTNYKEKGKLGSFLNQMNTANSYNPTPLTTKKITTKETTTTTSTTSTTTATPTTKTTIPSTTSTTTTATTKATPPQTTTAVTTTLATTTNTSPTTTTASTTTPTTNVTTTTTTTTKPPTTTTVTTLSTSTITSTRKTTLKKTTSGQLTTICNIGNVYTNSDLKGGLRSGNFLDRGPTSSILQCMELCCLMPTCDLAYMISGRCYLVECFTKDLCQVIPKGLSSLAPTVGLISRPAIKRPTTASTVRTTTLKTTTRPTTPPTYKGIPRPPSTLQQINELENQLQHSENNDAGTENPSPPPEACIFGAVLDHTSMAGGLRAGNFTHQGLVDSMDTCQQKCCKIHSCDIAILMRGACFAVSCKKKALCKPRKARLPGFSLKLSYRKRPGVDISFDYEHPNAVPTVATPKTMETTASTLARRKSPTTKRTKTTLKTTVKPTTTTTTTTTARRKTTTTKVTANSSLTSDVETVDLPKKPGAGVQSWCTTDFILEGVKLAGGLHSGTYQEIGRLDDISTCVQRCCDTRDCTTAYIERGTCYAVKCLDKDLCKSVVADSRSSVGYVIRDGWTVFKSAKEALSGAVLSVQTTTGVHLQPLQNLSINNGFGMASQTDHENVLPGLVVSGKGQSKSVNGSKPIPPPGLPNGTSKPESKKVSPLPFPESPQGPGFGYCEKGKTIINSRLLGGLAAGNFTNHGTVSDIETCTEYCCKDRECHLAYLVEETCYSVHCFTEDLCKTFKAPGGLYNPILSFVYRNESGFQRGDRKGGIGNGSVTGLPIPGVRNTPTQKKSTTVANRLKVFTLPSHRPTPISTKNTMTIKNKKKPRKTWKKTPLKLLRHKKKHPAKEQKQVPKKKKADENKLHRIFDELMSGMEPSSGALKIHHHKAEKKKSRKHSARHKIHAKKKLRLKTTKTPIFTRWHHTTPTSASSSTHVPIPLSKMDVATIESLSEDAPGQLDRCPARAFGCEHFCVALNHGGHRCMCHEGFRLSLDGRHCLEQEECDARSHNCEQYCVFEDGDFRCQCRSGYILNIANNTCDDINECTIGINGCDQICVNTPGSYKCLCRSGFRLSDDQMTCLHNGDQGKEFKKDTVERVPKFSIPATIIHRPNNTFVKSGRSVILDCVARGHPLPKVAWAAGYLSRGPLPKDSRFVVLPEGSLLIQNVKAGDQGYYQCIAINVAGSDAAEALLRVEDFDHCKQTPSKCAQICNSATGGYSCGCYRGYILNNDNHTCDDLNECSTWQHGCSQYCFNTQGSYVCGCKVGYRLSPDAKSCWDVNECQEGSHICPQICNNTIGAYTCSCNKGFRLQSDNTTCERIPMHAVQDKHQILFSAGFSAMISLSIVLTGALCLTLLVLIKNYKKRLKIQEMEQIGGQPLYIHSKSKAIFSWIE